MRIPTYLSRRTSARRQNGIALVTCLLILVMLTLLAISMYRGFGLQNKIAANTREKERAFEAAESTLQYGEYWLQLNKVLSKGNIVVSASGQYPGVVGTTDTIKVRILE